MSKRGPRKLRGTFKVLTIILLLLLAGAIYFLLPGQQLLLTLFFLPPLVAANWFGRKGALLAVLGALGLVGGTIFLGPALLAPGAGADARPNAQPWLDLAIWGACLLITSYVMGSLFARKQAQIRELHDSYWGFLPILNLFVNKDEYTQNHTQRVAVYAARIAAAMGLPEERVEDVRAAALVRDIGKVRLSREALTKAARLSPKELKQGASHRSGVGGSLRRILPIILAQPAMAEGTSEKSGASSQLPLEARILAVADVYASLTADRPYRKAMSPGDARDVIVRGAGREFDQEVINAFERAFSNREMEAPEGSV